MPFRRSLQTTYTFLPRGLPPTATRTSNEWAPPALPPSMRVSGPWVKHPSVASSSPSQSLSTPSPHTCGSSTTSPVQAPQLLEMHVRVPAAQGPTPSVPEVPV